MSRIKFTNQPVIFPRLRTAKLASPNGAKFGMTRKNKDGSPRCHQGIDLAIENGYRCYAVEKSTVVGISVSEVGYGKTITLKLDTNNILNGLYAFYAHLSRIDVEIGDKLDAGDRIGLTGSSGNAKGMNDIENGSHLHFELREVQQCGKGLKGRIDPYNYIF